MSCGGCGCCPKCGCSATCTCNRNIFSLESQSPKLSYANTMNFTVADANNSQGSSQCYYGAAAGENGGDCGNWGWSTPGRCA